MHRSHSVPSLDEFWACRRAAERKARSTPSESNQLGELAENVSVKGTVAAAERCATMSVLATIAAI
jgi:hypothetical protein